MTTVTPGEDALYEPADLEIKWAAEDALPFPFCISAIGEAPDCPYLENISVARGNVILVDHGRTTGPEDLGQVPARGPKQCASATISRATFKSSPGLFRPELVEDSADFPPGVAGGRTCEIPVVTGGFALAAGCPRRASASPPA